MTRARRKRREPQVRIRDSVAYAALALLCTLTLLPVFQSDRLPYTAAAPGAAPSAVQMDIVRAYAAQKFIANSQASGEPLLWNPFEYSGAPFLAAAESRIFSPFTIPFYLADFEAASRLSAWLKLITAAWLAFFACRKFGVPRPYAFLAATAYALPGPLLFTVMTPAADAWPWFPLLFLLADRMAMKQLRQWPFIAFVLALILVSGSWAFALSAMVTITLYILILAARRVVSSSIIAIVFGLSAAVGCAALIAAVQILPYLDYRAWAGESMTGAQSAIPGWPLWLPFFPALSRGETPVDTATAFGAVFAVPTAFLWLAIRGSAPRDYQKRVDTLMGIAWLTWIASWAVLHLSPKYGIVPGQLKGIAIPPTFLLLLTVGIVGDAWEQLSRTNKRERLLARGRWSLYTSLGLLAIGLIFSGFNAGGDVSVAASIAYVLGLSAFVATFIAIGNVSRSRLLPYALAIVVGLTLAYQWHPWNRWEPSEEFSTWAGALEIQDVGIVGGNRTIRHLPLMASQVRSPYGIFNRPAPEFAALLDATHSEPEQLNREMAIQFLWLGQEDLRREFLPLRPSMILHAAMPGDAALFRSLGEVQEVRLQNPETGEAINLGVRRFDRRNGWLYAEVDASAPGVLVVPDAHHPGWTARLDGRITAVEKSGPFIAVPLAAPGRHTIEFRYREPALERGLILSVAGLLLFLGGLMHFGYRSWHTRT